MSASAAPLVPVVDLSQVRVAHGGRVVLDVPALTVRGGEILVVIGILALLIGLLTPMIVRTMRRGVAMKTAADLNAIGIALDAYKQDFGDYPRVPSGPNPENQSLGAAILGMALLGPYGDGVIPPTPPVTNDLDDPPAYVNTKEYRAGQCVPACRSR